MIVYKVKLYISVWSSNYKNNCQHTLKARGMLFSCLMPHPVSWLQPRKGWMGGDTPHLADCRCSDRPASPWGIKELTPPP